MSCANHWIDLGIFNNKITLIAYAIKDDWWQNWKHTGFTPHKRVRCFEDGSECQQQYKEEKQCNTVILKVPLFAEKKNGFGSGVDQVIFYLRWQYFSTFSEYLLYMWTHFSMYIVFKSVQIATLSHRRIRSLIYSQVFRDQKLSIPSYLSVGLIHLLLQFLLWT